MIRRLTAVVVAAVVAALAASTPVTLAVYRASRTASATFAAGSLLPPSSLTATGGAAASLAWSASTSNATGYLVLRSGSAGGAYTQVATVTPVSARQTADTPPIAGVYYYVLDTFAGGWVSSHSNEVSVVVGAQTTTPTVGCHDATTQAADTGGNGDGYDLNPASACVQGGGYATDTNSGTTNVNSCSDAGKDRHRFWGYAFNLTGPITSIYGITLTAIAGQSNSGGISSLCVQLSWDGGTTWTAAKQVGLSAAALTTYTLGSTTDTWGHAWTAAQLTSSAFRIRITDVATTANKDFRLDFLGASVTYTP